MGNTISRRELLRTGALLAGGLPFTGSLFEKAQAAPSVTGTALTHQAEAGWTERDIALNSAEPLKARLFANENPFGPSEPAKKAILETIPVSYQYPFRSTRDLTGKIAEFEKIRQENIALSAGSTPFLTAAALAYFKPGCNVISGDPTYADLPGRAERLGAKWVKVPLTAEYRLDLDAMEKAIDDNTTLVYICNPNNPTATVVDTARLKDFCARVSKKVTVFVDEAYMDYLPDPQGTTLIPMATTGNNIIVARTFSKVYGFAGLRCGYVVTHPDIINKLSMHTDGFMSLSTTTLQAAIAAYQDGTYMDGVLKKTAASKEFLYSVLKKEGYTYVPSVANFVIFPIKMEGKQFADEMMKRSVGVRFWKFGNQDWCRISIGRMDEMEAFAAAFREIS